MNLILSLLLTLTPIQQTRVSIDAGEIIYDAKTQKTCAKDVTLTFKDGSKLISRKALVDTESLEGIEAIGADDEPLVYTGLTGEKGGERRPFVIQAKKMCVSMEKGLTVVATGNVQITYDKVLTAYGDMAIYRGQGALTLSGSKAHAVHESGAELFAREFEYNPKLKQLDAIDLELKIPEFGHSKAVNGKAKIGRFYIEENKFLFSKGGELNAAEQLTATSDGIIEVSLKEDQLEKVVVSGLTHIETSEGQKIVCPGKILFIPGRKHLEAKAFEGKEISFSDSQGSLFAEYVRLQFLDPESLNQVEKAMLKGNVKLSGISFFPKQYVLAQEVRLDLLKKKALLRASEDKPVLFYDPEQNIELSAPKVLVNMLPEGKLKAQGTGTVRLKFTSEEQNLIKLFF